MTKGTEYYQESELRKFTSIGFLLVIGLVAAGYFLSHVADEKMSRLNPYPHKTILSEPASTGSLPAR